jgi:hypothetical protein
MLNFRKALTIGIMSITVLSMSMLAVPMHVGAAAQAGDLIKMDGLSSVYYLGADGKRYVFPNESTYFSWYSDFSTVVTIPQSELESYPLGKNVTMRPGTKLVKITTSPKVYAVEPNGMLKAIPDEATAKALWGMDWAKWVVDVADAFFTNYTVSSMEVSSDMYPEGSLVKFGGDDIYYIDGDGMARKVSGDAAFSANRFQNMYVVSSTMTMPGMGDMISEAESTISDTSQGGGYGSGSASAGSGLSAALASDTPASQNVPQNSSNPFMKFNLMAASDGMVKVSTLKLTSYGLGDGQNIDNVTIYDGENKLTTSKNVNSDREAIFNFSDPIMIPAGGMKTITVKAKIAATDGNYALGIASAADIGADGATVSGSFPIMGNTMAAVNVSIGTATLSSVDGTNESGVEFGADGILLANFNITTANEDIRWTRALFRNGGTNNNDIAGNIKLMIDGDEVATGSLSDRYLDFNFDHNIEKGDTITVDVYGDIGVANANDTIALYIKDDPDFVFTGVTYGYGIEMDNALLDTSDEGKTITLSTGDFSIDMDKSATPTKDVRADDNDVVFATIKMTSNGENATLENITGTTAGLFYVDGAGLEDTEMENFEMKDMDTGAIYDLSATWDSGNGRYYLVMSDEINFTKGVTKTFQLRADLDSAIDNNDKIQVFLYGSGMRVMGDTSDTQITDITPSSVSSAVATVKAAALTWTTTTLTSKTIVPGAQDVVVYKASLEAGDSSDVTLTTVKVDVDNTNYVSFTDSNISRLTLFLDGKEIATKSNSIANDGEMTGYITFTSLNTTNRVVPAGQTVDLEMIADFASTFSATGTMSLRVESATANVIAKDIDNNAVAESVTSITTTSRDLTLASVGTLKVDLKTDDMKADDDTYILAGGETTKDRYLGEIEFTTSNEDILVEEMTLTNGGSTDSGDVKYVILYDKDGNKVAEKQPAATGNVTFDNFDYVLPADQVTSLFIGVKTKTINAEGDPEGTTTFNQTIKYNFGASAFTIKGVESTDAITMTQNVTGTLSDNEYAKSTTTTKIASTTGSILNSIVNSLADGNLTGGTGKTIGKYTFVFDNGTNRTSSNEELKAELTTLILNVATSSGVNVTNIQAHIEGNASDKTTAVESSATGEATIDLTTLSSTNELVDGEITLVITATISGVGDNDFVQTEIDNLATDFTYNGNHNSGGDFSNALLDINEVIGATFSNY